MAHQASCSVPQTAPTHVLSGSRSALQDLSYSLGTAKQAKCQFFGDRFPQELRDDIYSRVISKDSWRASLHVCVNPITALLSTCQRVHDEAQHLATKLVEELYIAGTATLCSKLQPLIDVGLHVEHTKTSALGGISIAYHCTTAPHPAPFIALAKFYACVYETIQRNPDLRVYDLAIKLYVECPTMPVEFGALLCALRLVPGVKVCSAVVKLPETACRLDRIAGQALQTELRRAVFGKPDNDPHHLTDNVLKDLQYVRDWCTPRTEAPRFFGVEPIFYCCDYLEYGLADSVEAEIADETLDMPLKPSFEHARKSQMIVRPKLNATASAFLPGAAFHVCRLCREGCAC